jgi:signal transduction histidine kinase
MTLRNRLVLTIGGIALLLVLPALFAVKQLERVRDIAAVQAQLVSRANLSLGRLQARLAELDRVQRTFIIAPDDETRTRMYESLAHARQHVANLGAYGFAEHVSPAGAWLDSLEVATQHVDELVSAGEAAEATAYFEEVKPFFTEAEATLTEIALALDAQSQAELREAQQISAAAMTSTILALGICLVFALGLGLYTTRVLSRPILRLRRAMSDVAGGEFVVPPDLPYGRPDEIGDVSRSFRSMTQRLSELDRMKAEFMSIATHELKTPINVIGGYAELMQERVYGEISREQEQALASMREQAQVLTSLVNQLLDVSRLEAGGLSLEMQTVAVSELLGRTERSFSPLARKQQIDFTVQIEPSVPDHIEIDAERVGDQVLGNVLANALKFTPSGGRIAVRAWSEAGRLFIEVADSGHGIPADKLPYVFDKFFQVGEQARSQGAGLGLAIAREVVEAHGGVISAQSEPGRGTRFLIDLPTSPPAGAAAVEYSRPAESAPIPTR